MATTAKPSSGMPGNYSPALTVGTSGSGYSILPVDNEIAVGGARGANPVNSTTTGTRPGVGLVGGIESTPAVQASRNVNPKLNIYPWSTSMAQPRSETKVTQKRHNTKKGYNS